MNANTVSENVLTAMQIVGESLLEGLKFDQTIKCSVVDASEADKGIYQVSNGSAIFTAYSTEKYKKNASVYVMIPQGDYDNQKMIVGKAAKKDEINYKYVAPLENLLSIYEFNEGISEGQLLANNPDEGSVQLYQWSGSANTDTKTFYLDAEGNTATYRVKPTSGGKNGFTRLGLSGDFKSLLTSFRCKTGDYGLKVEVTFENSSIITHYGEVNDKGEVNAVPGEQIVYTRSTRVLKLAAADMIGNPYQFDTFFQQEKLFDITDLGNIVDIKISFYQEAGSFENDNENEDENKIPYRDEIETGIYVNYPNNLFVQNVNLSLGFDIRDQQGEFVQVYSDTAYYNDEKSIDVYLRWSHEGEDGQKEPLDFDDYNTEEKTITYNGQAIPIKINWYRYNLGEPSDGIGGVNWLPINHVNNNPFECNVLNTGEKIKAVIIWNVDYYESDKYDYDTLYRSNILTIEAVEDGYGDKLRNELLNSLGPQVSYETYKEALFNRFALDGELSIKCYDNANKETYGNYLVYDEQNNLIDRAYANNLQTLELSFKYGDDIYKFTTDDENDNEIALGEDPIWSASSLNMFKFPGWEENQKFSSGITQSFYIRSHLDSQYTTVIVSCTVKIPGGRIEIPWGNEFKDVEDKPKFFPETEFTAVQTLTFGQAGTQGATCTLALDFGLENVFTVGTASARTVNLYVYDENNKEITNELTDNTNFSVEWSWYQATHSTHLQIVKTGERTDKLKFSNTIAGSTALSINDIYILQATLKGWKNSGSETGYDLTAYLPIPIRSSVDYSHISGADKVVYLSDGTPKCYTGAYELYNGSNVISGINWKANVQAYTDSPLTKEQQAHNEKVYNLPSVKAIKDSNGDSIIGYRLQPASYYNKNIIDSTPFAVQATIMIDGAETIVWTQPILIIQNQYFSSVVNNWDGKTVQIDEKNGDIMAARIGAGRKNSSNQFSGVVLGDWKNSNLEYKGTGLFGFRDGQMSFGFKDDGIAFIGQASGGQLLFDGDQSQISSSSYRNSSSAGMLIDFNNPKIHMRQGATDLGYAYIKDLSQYSFAGYLYEWQYNQNPSSYSSYYYYDNDLQEYRALSSLSQGWVTKYVYIRTNTSQNKIYLPVIGIETKEQFEKQCESYEVNFLITYIDNRPITVASANFDSISYPKDTVWYHPSHNEEVNMSLKLDATSNIPLTIGDNFKVDWNGNLFAKSGEFTGIINSTGGTISGPMDITGTLTVKSDIDVSNGRITANRGTIGGWEIGYSTLSGGNTTLHSTNGITTNIFKINNSNYGLTGRFGGIETAQGHKVIGLSYGDSDNGTNWIGANDSKVAMQLGTSGSVWIDSNGIQLRAATSETASNSTLALKGKLYGNANNRPSGTIAGQIYFEILE